MNKPQYKLVTPELATEYLAKNPLNRKRTDRHINFLAQQMTENKWLETGDTIKFDEKGNLLDGQHRLSAIIKSGKSQHMLVVEGLDKKAFEVMDTGRSRTSSDVLSAKGYKNSMALSSGIKNILLYGAGIYGNMGHAIKTPLSSNAKVLEFIKKNPELEEIGTYCNTLYKRFRFLKPSDLVVLYWLFSKQSQTDCDRFFEEYSTGIGLTADSPVRILRERLLKESTNKRKLPAADRLALCIIAWNNFRTKKATRTLNFNSQMSFPKPI